MYLFAVLNPSKANRPVFFNLNSITMQRRKYGYLLLILLVVSGLAGTPTDNTLNKQERKFALDHLKASKAEVLKSVKGLSEAQLNFKAAEDKWSVKECIYHIAISESNIWGMFEGTMKTAANPDKRKEIKVSDEDLIKMMENRGFKVKTSEKFEPRNTPYKSLDEALADFKSQRMDHIKYVKGTTEDLRNHVAQTPLGWVDGYQLILFVSSHTNRHVQQINEVKADPGYPVHQ